MTPAPKPAPRPPKAKRPPRKRNVKRHTREWLRAYGSVERVEWVKLQQCVVGTFLCDYGSENAHIETGGTRRKADADKIVPLCQHHHRMLHKCGRQEFEAVYHIDLAAYAARTRALWQLHKQRTV